MVLSTSSGPAANRELSEVRVVPSVVLHRMSIGGNLPGDLGMLGGVPAGLEECGRSAVSSENGKDLRCVQRVWAIVEGECYDAIVRSIT